MGRLPGISGDIRVQREESRRAAERAVGRPLRDSEVSRYYPEDDEYLIEKHPNVEHHEVVELGRTG